MKFQLLYLPLNNFKILVIHALLILLCGSVNAQESKSTSRSRMTLYADMGGGIGRGLASLNFEAQIASSKKITWYGRGGIGGGGIEDDGGPGILGGITMLTGKKNGHFEINAGTFVGKYTDVSDEIFFLPILDAGYRYQKPSGGLLFRVRVGYLGIGFGVGYAF